MTAETTETKNAEQPAQQADGNANALTRELESAYAQGDFARLRKRARELSADASVPEVLRERARSFSARVSVDVAVYAMLAFAFALFCAIVMRYALP